jgi:MoaA/NifB/PqqE/SkfB family radical SAM enzyme
VAVSVHSHRPEIEDERMTRVPGNLARKVAGLRNMLSLRAEGYLQDNVSLNPVVSRLNLGELDGYVEFFSGLGLRDIRFNLIWPEGDVREDPAWIPRLSEAVPVMARLALLNEKKPRARLTFGGIPPCTLRFAGLSPRLRGYVAAKYFDEPAYDPANDVALAAGGGKPRFVWQQQKRDVLKTQAPGCASCSVRGRCEGVWRSYAELYGFSELEPLAEERRA